jgi:hypothetical protein
VTADGYHHAIRKLIRRYGDKIETRRALIERLASMKANSYHTDGLTTMFDQWSLVLRSMEALGGQVERDEILIEGLLAKLPAAMQTQVDLEREGGRQWTIASLSTAVGRISESRRATDQRPRAEKAGNVKRRNGQGSRAVATVEDATSTASSRNVKRSWHASNEKGKRPLGSAPRPAKCALCDGDYCSDERGKFLKADERKRALIERKRCLLCLRTGHFAKDYSAN